MAKRKPQTKEKDGEQVSPPPRVKTTKYKPLFRN